MLLANLKCELSTITNNTFLIFLNGFQQILEFETLSHFGNTISQPVKLFGPKFGRYAKPKFL